MRSFKVPTTVMGLPASERLPSRVVADQPRYPVRPWVTMDGKVVSHGFGLGLHTIGKSPTRRGRSAQRHLLIQDSMEA